MQLDLHRSLGTSKGSACAGRGLEVQSTNSRASLVSDPNICNFPAVTRICWPPGACLRFLRRYHAAARALAESFSFRLVIRAFRRAPCQSGVVVKSLQAHGRKQSGSFKEGANLRTRRRQSAWEIFQDIVRPHTRKDPTCEWPSLPATQQVCIGLL